MRLTHKCVELTPAGKLNRQIHLENALAYALLNLKYMKPRFSNQRNHALTLIEVLVVVVVLAVLVAIFLPSGPVGKDRAMRFSCVNNLKQIGLAYRIWAGDNNDKYPMEISVTNGGTLELVGGPDAWKTFQVMSNELSTPKVIFCPADSERGSAATNFGDDLKNKISYFIGVDATTNENVLLSGDDHFLINGSPVKPGLIEVTSNTPIAWDSSHHVSVESRAWFFKKKTGWGNIGLGDGSVQSLSSSNLLEQIKQIGLATNRLAIP